MSARPGTHVAGGHDPGTVALLYDPHAIQARVDVRLEDVGRFVDNLRAEDFELRVDNKPQTISFFERVKAGSLNEEAQLAAARGGRAGTPDGNATVRPLDAWLRARAGRYALA